MSNGPDNHARNCPSSQRPSVALAVQWRPAGDIMSNDEDEPGLDADERRIRAAIAAGRLGDAVERVRTTYGAAVFRLAYRMVKDPIAAEDVVQDALLRIHRSLCTVRIGTSLRAWVMSVAHHCALDELRRRGRRRRRIHEGADIPEIADDGPQPSHAVETRQRVRVLLECLDALPPRVRASVLLHFGQELTFDQVGALLRDKGSTVQVRVNRALPRLRAQLRRRGVDPNLRSPSTRAAVAT
jgi:RNA polymerase sigma factor (sigma-70 family)